MATVALPGKSGKVEDHSETPPLESISFDWLSTLSHDQLSHMVAHVQSYIEDSQRDLQQVNQIGQDLARELHGAPHDILMAKIHQLKVLHEQNTQLSHSLALHSNTSVSATASDTLYASSAKHLLTPSPSPPIRYSKDSRQTSPFLPYSVDQSFENDDDDGWETEEEVHISNGHVRHASNVSLKASQSSPAVRTVQASHYTPIQIGASPHRHLLQDWNALEMRNLELQDELDQATAHSQSIHLVEQHRLRKLQSEIDILRDSMQDLEAENAALRSKSNGSPAAPGFISFAGSPSLETERADTSLIHELHSKVSDLESINAVISTNREILMRRLDNALNDLSNLKAQYDLLETSSRDYIQLQEAFEKQEDHIEQLQNALEEYRGTMVPYPASPVGWEKRIGLYVQNASRPSSAASLYSTRHRSGSLRSDHLQPTSAASIRSRARGDSTASYLSSHLHERHASNSNVESLQSTHLQPSDSSRPRSRQRKPKSKSRSRSSHKHSVILASPSRKVHMPKVMAPKKSLLSELETEWLRQAAEQSYQNNDADDDRRSTSSTLVRKAYSDVRRRFGTTESVNLGDDPLTAQSQTLQTFDNGRNKSMDSRSSSILRYRGKRYPRLYDSDDDEDWDRGRSPVPFTMQEDMFSDYEVLQVDELGMERFYGGQSRGLIGRGMQYYLDWVGWAMTWIQFLAIIGIAVVIAVYRGPQEIMRHKRITGRS